MAIRKDISDKTDQQEDGAVAVEFALIAPVLLLIVAGIFYFGQLFAIANSLQQLAAETARATVPGLDSQERQQLADNFIAKSADRFPFLNAQRVQKNIEIIGTGQHPSISVNLTYDLDGTFIALGNAAFGSDMTSLVRSSYLAY